MFAGYPRSGHTLVASMLNAHPNVICSNQMFIMYEMKGDPELGIARRNSILSKIESGSQRSQWKPEAYVEPLPKKEITVIGDKTGHRTIEHLISNPENLEPFKRTVQWPIKWIHVYRNPFDNLATWTKLNVDNRKAKVPRITQEQEFENVFKKYQALNEKIVEMKKTENVLSVAHERVIRFIDRTLDDICSFLEIEKYDEWRTKCIKTKWKDPRITRRNINWTPSMRAKVAKLSKQYPWLYGYDFGGG